MPSERGAAGADALRETSSRSPARGTPGRRPGLDVTRAASDPAAPDRGTDARGGFEPLPGTCALTIVVPVYNEIEGLDALLASIRAAMPAEVDWELLLVDDGSSDGSAARIRDLAQRDGRVVGVFLPRHCGQTSAMAAGFERARHDLIGTLDADLQTAPSDLLRLIDELDDYDAVVGYRARRRDTWLRRASSRIANAVRDRITGDSVRDTGCPLKLFRRQALQRIPLFEGMHRFLPTLLRMHGFRVREVPVAHGPRVLGRSKYGVFNRLGRSLVDLAAVVWMRSRILPCPGDVRTTREP